MKAVCLAKGSELIFSNVELTETLSERMKGLLGRDSYGVGHVMWLSPCSSIHTFFMRFSLDLVFLDKCLRVVAVKKGVRSGRMVFGGARARSVLEMSEGWLDDVAIQVGDMLIEM